MHRKGARGLVRFFAAILLVVVATACGDDGHPSTSTGSDLATGSTVVSVITETVTATVTTASPPATAPAGTQPATTTAAAASTAADDATGYGPPGRRTEFGQIASLEQQKGRWVMRFDPALMLSGETANVAAAEDGVISPGEPMPNDNYIVDESHRLYTYLVADDAEVEVLTRSADQTGVTRIGVADLADLVHGASTIELFEPITTGAWISYHVDTVDRIVQQYRP